MITGGGGVLTNRQFSISIDMGTIDSGSNGGGVLKK